TDDRRLVRVGLSIAAPGVVPLPTTMQAERYPWTLGTLRRGDVVRFRSPEQLPDDAAIDRATFQELGTRSLVCLPLEVGHVIVGGISLVTVRAERDWSDALIPRLRLLGDIFASSLVRRRASNAIWESEARFRLAADSAPIMMWMASPDGGSTYVNRGWLDFTGRKMEEELGDGWTTGVHPDDRKGCLDRYRRALMARESFNIVDRVCGRRLEHASTPGRRELPRGLRASGPRRRRRDGQRRSRRPRRRAPPSDPGVCRPLGYRGAVVRDGRGALPASRGWRHRLARGHHAAAEGGGRGTTPARRARPRPARLDAGCAGRLAGPRDQPAIGRDRRQCPGGSLAAQRRGPRTARAPRGADGHRG